MLSKPEAIALIQELHAYDHRLMGQEAIDYFAKPFGLTIQGYKNYESPHIPKGLTLDEGPHVLKDKRGRYALGMEASQFAMRLCGELGVKYRESMGRGSQLRNCIEALTEYAGSLPEKAS